jgi:hypothetical protein
MLSPSSARVKRLLRGSADRPAERKPARSHELLYSVDETPPRAVLVVAALQHVALMSNFARLFHRPGPRSLAFRRSGYLLRRSADPDQLQERGERAEVHLHYDH